jgi:hypothetical protein
MYVYYIEGPDYTHTWVHSSKQEYVDKNEWLLYMFSMGVLIPEYKFASLIQIPSACPVVNNIQQNYYISEEIKQNVYYKEHHQIAIKDKTYSEFIQTESGDIESHEIKALKENYFLITCMATSLILAFSTSIFCLLRFFDCKEATEK